MIPHTLSSFFPPVIRYLEPRPQLRIVSLPPFNGNINPPTSFGGARPAIEEMDQGESTYFVD